ncbi:AfsR/SARP family transcriptional regulator [Ornithinimicrobium sp. Y1847]|uniref:AfsR/SARP family transcriptional regulator n=1 Tax=Ornithinimicrobium sp. Y1847 TaxID=3405419 RepID=UPI003B672A93
MDRARVVYLDALVRSGNPGRALPALLMLTEDLPDRGDVVQLTVLAYYRTSRPAEALQLLRKHRRYLVDEQGLDPGPWLDILEQRILTNDLDLRGDEDRAAAGPDLLADCPHCLDDRYDAVRCAQQIGAAVAILAPDAPEPTELTPCADRCRAELGEWGFLRNAMLGAFSVATTQHDPRPPSQVHPVVLVNEDP